MENDNDDVDDKDEFTDTDIEGEFSDIETKGLAKAGQAGLTIASGAIPGIGGLLAWIASNWDGKEEERANQLFLAWFKMIQDEIKEKQRVLGEVLARLDLQNDEINERVKSDDFQRLIRKALRNWNGAESRRKQDIIRNILTNAASNSTSSDDVVSLFLDWIATYSEFHFEVISAIYNDSGITRGGIWRKLGRPSVRENSADADLFKLLIRDLATGSVIRQHRRTDYQGNFIKIKSAPRGKGSSSSTMKSAFDENEPYELTELGTQFVHYALNEVVPKVEFDEESIL